MQDRKPTDRPNLLQRTAAPYIRVKCARLIGFATCPLHLRVPNGPRQRTHEEPRWLRPHPIRLLYEQSLAATPVQHCSNTLLQLGGLVLIVMRRALDPNIFLVCCRKG